MFLLLAYFLMGISIFITHRDIAKEVLQTRSNLTKVLVFLTFGLLWAPLFILTMVKNDRI